MKKIVVSIQNNLLAESITKILADSGVFNPFRVPVHRKNKDTAKQCEALQTELLLAEVSYSPGTTVDTRLEEAAELRRILPGCLIVFLCDENSAPDIAKDVMLAKKDGKIDAFFYTSVTQNYLLAALEAL